MQQPANAKRWALVVVASALCALGGCASVGSSSPEQDVGEAVREVARDLLGSDKQVNYKFEIKAPAKLVTAIREQTYLGRWQRREDYDQSQLPGLVARLEGEAERVLQSRGYFNSSSEVERLPDGVMLTVNAGARTTVNDVQLQLVGAVDSQRRVREYALARWNLPTGSFFESSRWKQSKRELIEALNQQGYLRARITASKAAVDRQLTAASVSLEVDSGPRIAFGALQIIGLERYGERIINDLRPFRQGTPYTLDQLLLFQARLRASGYFKDVSVLPLLSSLEENPQAEEVPVQVTVIELQSKRAVLGVGFSTDEGLRGQIGLEHRDLFNRDWQLESALVMSNKRQRAFANVRTPYDAQNYFNGFGGRLEREDIEGQVTTRSNSYIGRGRRVGDIEAFVSLQYQIERQRLEPSNRTTSQRALVLGYSWNLRRLDSSVDPRRGYTVSAQLSGARRGFATDRSFVRFYARAMRFFPLPADSRWRNGTLIALGEFGLVRTRSAQDIPTENLFRTGGAQTVRGYRYLSLGVDEQGATVGGRFLGVASLEYQHRMSDLYSLAAFFDYGNASDTVGDFDPVAGYGVGVRLRTPVGSINLDLAYGRGLHRWRAHFSVGYTF